MESCESELGFCFCFWISDISPPHTMCYGQSGAYLHCQDFLPFFHTGIPMFVDILNPSVPELQWKLQIQLLWFGLLQKQCLIPEYKRKKSICKVILGRVWVETKWRKENKWMSSVRCTGSTLGRCSHNHLGHRGKATAAMVAAMVWIWYFCSIAISPLLVIPIDQASASFS